MESSLQVPEQYVREDAAADTEGRASPNEQVVRDVKVLEVDSQGEVREEPVGSSAYDRKEQDEGDYSECCRICHQEVCNSRDIIHAHGSSFM